MLACGPSQGTTATNTDSDTDPETTSASETAGPTDTTTDDPSDTMDTVDTADTEDPGACADTGPIDETPHACGCIVNTCANGVFEACDGDGGWPGCSVESMMLSVTYCGGDRLECGKINESCSDFDCESDPSKRTYSEAELNCTLEALRDRTPGTYGWHSTLDGNYSGEAGVFHLRKDGAKWGRTCDFEDLGASIEYPAELELESPDYFVACLAMPQLHERFSCMQNGLTHTAELSVCGAGAGGPPPVGTCPNGGVSWAGSAILRGTDPSVLQGFEGVECIEGPLILEDITCPEGLQALGSVRSVDGGIQLRNLEASDLQWLSSLESLNGSMTIQSMPQLTSLSGLENLGSIPGELSITDIPQLTDLHGLEGLTSVDTLYLRFLGLESLDGLGPVSPTDLEIWECASLASIANLTGITTAAQVRLLTLPALTSYAGLENLTSVEFLQLNTGATDLTGFDALAQVSAFDIRGENLTDVGPLPSLTTVDSLSVELAPNLTSLTGVAAITDYPERLHFRNLPALTSLNDFAAVQTIGSFDVWECDGLTNLEGLENLTKVTDFQLEQNASLQSVEGLDSLTEVSERFIIRENPELVDMSGMLQSPSVGGRLQFWHNDSLLSLAGMEGVTSIVGDLHVIGNAVLPTIAGLANVQFVDGHLKIEDNPQLPTQEAQDFADMVEVTGTKSVSGNG